MSFRDDFGNHLVELGGLRAFCMGTTWLVHSPASQKMRGNLSLGVTPNQINRRICECKPISGRKLEIMTAAQPMRHRSHKRNTLGFDLGMLSQKCLHDLGAIMDASDPLKKTVRYSRVARLARKVQPRVVVDVRVPARFPWAGSYYGRTVGRPTGGKALGPDAPARRGARPAWPRRFPPKRPNLTACGPSRPQSNRRDDMLRRALRSGGPRRVTCHRHRR